MLSRDYKLNKQKLRMDYKIIRFTKIKLKIQTPPRYKSYKYFDKLTKDSMLYKIT